MDGALHAFVCVTRRIDAGREVLLDYGADYWQAFARHQRATRPTTPGLWAGAEGGEVCAPREEEPGAPTEMPEQLAARRAAALASMHARNARRAETKSLKKVH